MVSKPKRSSTRRKTPSAGMSKRRVKKSGKNAKMTSARKPNRSCATSKRTSSARTVAPTTSRRGKGGDEEE